MACNAQSVRTKPADFLQHCRRLKVMATPIIQECVACKDQPSTLKHIGHTTLISSALLHLFRILETDLVELMHSFEGVTSTEDKIGLKLPARKTEDGSEQEGALIVASQFAHAQDNVALCNTWEECYAATVTKLQGHAFAAVFEDLTAYDILSTLQKGPQLRLMLALGKALQATSKLLALTETDTTGEACQHATSASTF